jgi:hypothetical protein
MFFCASRVGSVSGAILCVCLVVAAGCSGRMKRLSPTRVDSKAAAANAMKMYDANQDGKLSKDELEKCPSLKAIASRDGEVTPELIVAKIIEWQSGGPGRVPVSFFVLHNGKPLADASVKLVAEKFLTDIVPGTGMTSANGSVAMSVPTSGPEVPKGVSLGFYKIEITKAGEEIPAKYNTETTLGLGVLGEVSGVKVDLKY